jgi:hypothetical protein
MKHKLTLCQSIIELHNGLKFTTLPEEIYICENTTKIPDWDPVYCMTDTGMIRLKKDDIKSISIKEL